MILALTGGTGFVGQALIERALAQGHELRALTRSEQSPRDSVCWVAGDMSDAASLAELVRGAEAVVHVAGLVKARDAEAFEACNVAGTLALIEAAHAEGVDRFIFVSSLSSREPTLSLYGASKAKAERLVAASGLDWTIIRPPAVYGPRDRDMLELFRAARWGVVPMPPRGSASVIHVDDLADLLLAVLPGGETISHAIFEPDDGRRGGWPHRELARAIGWSIGRRPWVPHLSKPALERLARADQLIRRSKAKLTLDRVGYMVHPDWVAEPTYRVPPEVWQPRIDTREGLKATAEWYRKQGWL